MRVSADCRDPGYLPYRRMAARGLWPAVTLNGQAMKRVRTADDDAGIVVVRLFEDGKPMRDDSGWPAYRTLHGNVEINFVPPAVLASEA